MEPSTHEQPFPHYLATLPLPGDPAVPAVPYIPEPSRSGCPQGVAAR